MVIKNYHLDTIKLQQNTLVGKTPFEKAYRQLYGWNGLLDDYTFDGDTPCYIFGLDAAKKMKTPNPEPTGPSKR